MQAQVVAEVSDVVNELFPELAKIWEDLGMPEAMVKGRHKAVVFHIRDLIESMTEQERNLKEKVFADIARYETTILGLVHGLGDLGNEEKMATTSDHQDEPALQKEKRLKIYLKSLEDVKTAREKEILSLIRRCDTLTSELGAKPHNLLGVDFRIKIPRRKDIDDLVKHRNQLEQEKSRRVSEYLEMRSRIRKGLAEIGESPDESFIVDVMSDAKEDYNIKMKNLQKLKEVEEGIECTRNVRRTEYTGLMDEIHKLWNLMGVMAEERRRVEVKATGLSRNSIDVLHKELESLRAVRRNSLEGLTTKAIKEIKEIHKKARLNEPDISTNLPVSEERLDQLTKRLEDAGKLLETRLPILNNIAVWEKNLRRLQEIEENAKDPSRLKNRGGKLLAEEKERKMLVKKLPKVLTSMLEEVECWQEKGGEFLIDGMTVKEYRVAILNEAGAKKEEVQVERQKKRKLETENEMRFGSKNPNKSKRPKTVFKMKVDRADGECSSSASLSSVDTTLKNKDISEVKITPWGTMSYSPNKPPMGPSTSGLGAKKTPGGGTTKSIIKSVRTAIGKKTGQIFGRSAENLVATAKTTDNLQVPSFKSRQMRRRSKSASCLRREDWMKNPIISFGNTSRNSRLPVPSAAGNYTSRPSASSMKRPSADSTADLHGTTITCDDTVLEALSETIECRPAVFEESVSVHMQGANQAAFLQDLLGDDRPCNARSSIIPPPRWRK